MVRIYMTDFIKVDEHNLNNLAALASEIWHEYWPVILSSEQIDYMVEKFQSLNAIKNQIEFENYSYYFIKLDEEYAGYFGISKKEKYLFLSKLYIKKDFRHKGIGRQAFEKIKLITQENNFNSIILTVNKYNANTISAYQKWGFETIDSVVTDIGNSYVMDDYIMEYKFL